MPRIEISLAPQHAHDETFIEQLLRKRLQLAAEAPLYYRIAKRSLDARRGLRYRMQVDYDLNSPLEHSLAAPAYRTVAGGKEVHIIGAGPAGLFAALRCLEYGLRPVLIERGKPVRERRRDLARITKEHKVDPDSNYCFGEGGAGTYSDGKLYTRSKKRGSVQQVLETLVAHGADGDILVDAHPHIGTNKLPQIITHMRETIIAQGGEVHFEAKLTGMDIHDGRIKSIQVNDAESYEVEHLILATGHSARDIFEMLQGLDIALEAKPFALGVRVEHPQELIDKIQYGLKDRGEYLPAASYSQVCQVRGGGVFSFCMCPGGIIAPCATEEGEIVTNGWSPSKRNNPYANSGIVAEVKPEHTEAFGSDALAGIRYQSEVERKACEMAGGNQTAPAQRLVDFVAGRVSSSLPDCSYHPGLESIDLHQLLPKRISESLREAFQIIGKKMPGYLTKDAVLVAPESRTSSPVRIPRDRERLEHTSVRGLYPCGEGAGYAGGIVSAAIDGQRCVDAIAQKLGHEKA